MPRSPFNTVLILVFVTWLLYMAILFAINAISGPIRAAFPEAAQQILILLAGILMLTPFIIVWDLFVLRRYYPRRARELSKREASRSPERSA